MTVGATLRIINTVNTSDPDNLITIMEGDVNGSVPLCVQLVSGGEIVSELQQNGLGRNVSLLLTTNEVTAGIIVTVLPAFVYLYLQLYIQAYKLHVI